MVVRFLSSCLLILRNLIALRGDPTSFLQGRSIDAIAYP
jgi:hypothetical protein